MENIEVQIPIINFYQKEFLVKALNYYKISSVEFSFDSDDIIFQSNNLIEMIELQSEMKYKK